MLSQKRENARSQHRGKEINRNTYTISILTRRATDLENVGMQQRSVLQLQNFQLASDVSSFV